MRKKVESVCLVHTLLLEIMCSCEAVAVTPSVRCSHVHAIIFISPSPQFYSAPPRAFFHPCNFLGARAARGGLARAEKMSCRRKASTTSAPSTPSADVGDRELSTAAKTRVEMKASKPAAGGLAAPAFPWLLFSGIFVCVLAALYLTIKYS